MTTGGHNSGGDDAGQKYWTWGGNVGPPPHGSWQHHERDGDGHTLFNFHSWDIEIERCYLDPPGPCHPKADVNVIEFFGTGKYSIGNGKKEYDAVFEARCEDHNEPGNTPDEDRGCGGDPDVYYIQVRDAGTNAVIFEHTELIDGGNIQIHPLKENQMRRIDGTATRKDLHSTGSGSDIEGQGLDVGRLELYKPAPNPFNSTTRIAYAVGGANGERVDIGIYNVSGRLVRKLISDDAGGLLPPGVRRQRASRQLPYPLHAVEQQRRFGWVA
jgi:hypothetical protein